MLLTVIFLISCVVTARLLDKKNMQIASIAYAVMIAVILFALAFICDVPFIGDVMSEIFGRYNYFSIQYLLREAIDAPVYSVFIVSAIAFTFAVQIAVTIFCFVDTITHLFKDRAYYYKKRKDFFKLRPLVSIAKIIRKINLLYCRMLN